MKKFFIIILLLFGCEKPEKETFVPPKNTTNVVESITNKPLAGAKVELYDWDWLNYIYLFSGFTDSNGICRVPIDILKDPYTNIAVTKQKNWGFNHYALEYSVSLQPEGWVQLHIRKANF